MTWESVSSMNPPDDAALDRLVDGSLPEARRCELLQSFEAEPDGWRRCALAFLEAQAWREALAPLAGAKSPMPTAQAAPVRPRPATSGRRLGRAAALAACVMAAFVAGWLLKPIPTDLGQNARIQDEPKALTFTQSPAPSESKAESAAEEPPSPVIDSFVRAWRQNGYSAERQKTVVTLTLPDGSELAVPADDIRLRYIADRTY